MMLRGCPIAFGPLSYAVTPTTTGSEAIEELLGAMMKLACLVALTGFSAMPLVAHAQSYPTRSITVVVPFPAGGPSDVVARIVTEHMGRTLGQQLVIENVGGAGGTLGSARVAAAQPDGYSLLAGSMGSHVAAPVLTPNVSSTTQSATSSRSASPPMRPP
jgi:tripartite-type tricarboxylate transporter receptor subunit TctC